MLLHLLFSKGTPGTIIISNCLLLEAFNKKLVFEAVKEQELLTKRKLNINMIKHKFFIFEL